MKSEFKVNTIGKIRSEKGQFQIEVNENFKSGLTNINGFSHLQIIYWAHLIDDLDHRSQLVNKKPYKKSPAQLGVFATRSQIRPNPILITTIFVEDIDQENGIIYTPYIDAENNTPLLDIKPLHLYEKVENNNVPTWCSHWPSSYEESANFDWQSEFNF